jgi:hypothetical protein
MDLDLVVSMSWLLMLPYYYLLAGLRSLYAPLFLLSLLRIHHILVGICLSRTVALNHRNVIQLNMRT